MNRVLDVGYTLNLSGKEFIIKEIVGKGASSVTYLAEYGKTEHILKECNPLGIAMHREENGKLVADTDLGKEKFKECLERFKAGADKQLSFRMTEDLKNPTSNIQAIYHANGTAYIDMTYFAGKTYDKVDDESLYDLFRRMKALAQIVGHYHKLGYLHLDIKPQNIYTIPETPEMVMMFDFDSIAPINLIKNIDAVISLSYTDVWAAPEQKMSKYRNQICEATDLFAIGEIIFYKLFDKHSEENDRYSFSHYEYPVKKNRFKNVNPRVFPMITELLHKTLSYSVKKRYQNVGQLISQLDEIIKLSNPKEPFLKSSLPNVSGSFTGRDIEIQEIYKRLQEDNVLFLSGIGGIGKSELAKHYAKEYEKDYDVIIFAPFIQDIETMIGNDNCVPIYNFSRYPEEKQDEYFARKMKELAKLSNKKTLFIIDNFDTINDNNKNNNFDKLISLNCKMLITTRIDFSDIFKPQQINVDKLENPLAVFNAYYQKTLSEEERKCIEEIIEIVCGHTMTIELLAKQMMAGRIDPQSMLERLKTGGLAEGGNEKIQTAKDGGTSQQNMYGHIKTLFDLSSLDKDDKDFLANLALIPYTGISTKLFCEWCEIDNFDIVNSLEKHGWIHYDRERDYISLHPVIAEVSLRFSIDVDSECLQTMLKNQSKYLEIYTSKKYFGDFKELSRVYEDIVIFNTLAENLVRFELRTEAVANVLTSIPELILGFGYIDRAIKYQKYVIDFSQKRYRENVAKAYNNLGVIYDTIGDFKQALRYSKLSLNIKKRPFWVLKYDNALSVSVSFNSLSSIYYHMGKYIKALKYAQNAFIIQKMLNDDMAIVSISNLVSIYEEIGDYDKAFRFSKMGIELKSKALGENSISYAISLSNLGSLYCDNGEFEKALVCFERALEIETDSLGGNHILVAGSWGNLGVVYHEMKDYEQAIACLHESLEIKRNLIGEDNVSYATSLSNLGSLYCDNGEFEKALQYMQEALRIEKNTFGEMHKKIAITLNNIAGVYDDMGEFEQALQTYEQALHIAKTLFGSHHKLVSVCFGNIAYIYEKNNDLKTARKYYEQAYNVCLEVFGEEHSDTKLVKQRLLNTIIEGDK